MYRVTKCFSFFRLLVKEKEKAKGGFTDDQNGLY